MEKTAKLFEEFPQVSSEDWKNKIVTDLKGADFDKKLVWKTIEGFNVQPYYRAENLEGLDYLDVMPGHFPFIRGKRKTNNSWFVRQDIEVSTPAEANKKALDVLMKGATSLGFVIEDSSAYTKDDVAALLNEITLDAVELCFVIKKGKKNFLSLFVELIKAQGVDPKEIKGSVNVDYLGNLTLKGAFCYDSQSACEDFMAEVLEITKELPKFKIFQVSADYFQNAGSTLSQELAFALAAGADYLSAASEKGLDAGLVAPRIKFNFAVGGNYFMEIAKFRAAKMLWAKVVDAYKPKCNDSCGCKCEHDTCCCAGKMNIHAITATFNKTVYDPYVNMLRTTTEAMSAALGGVDSLTVLPFNSIYEAPTEFSERIARNQQIILQEESYFDKIVDPGAGSYYIEQLTDKITEQAWKLFLEVQDKGGYAEAFKAGYVQEVINATVTERVKRIASRRDNVLGTNQFPNFGEIAEDGLDTSVFEKQSFKSDNAIAEPLQICRGSQAIELLRFKTDQFTKSSGKRPKAFMLTIGNLNFRKARAQFACNFFACAGIEVVDNNGFATVEEGVKAALEAKADIVVICSSDDEYAELAPAAAEQLKGKAEFVVAGAPACTEELKAKGIENFVHVRSNVLSDLQQYQAKLGIK